jgi:hypothetical protein
MRGSTLEGALKVALPVVGRLEAVDTIAAYQIRDKVPGHEIYRRVRHSDALQEISLIGGPSEHIHLTQHHPGQRLSMIPVEQFEGGRKRPQKHSVQCRWWEYVAKPFHMYPENRAVEP